MDDAQEARTTSQIQVRQITQMQASWTQQERGGPGALTLQLILDHGAAEYVLRPTADDADVLLQLFDKTKTAFFDMERGVVVFGNIALD